MPARTSEAKTGGNVVNMGNVKNSLCRDFARKTLIDSILKNILDFTGQVLFLLPARKKANGWCGIPTWVGKWTENDGAVAQLVEQWTENPCVAGSTPAHTTALKTLSVMMGFFVSSDRSQVRYPDLVGKWTENKCVSRQSRAHSTALKTLSVMRGFFV